MEKLKKYSLTSCVDTNAKQEEWKCRATLPFGDFCLAFNPIKKATRE
jgi:hypothetical protein